MEHHPYSTITFAFPRTCVQVFLQDASYLEGHVITATGNPKANICLVSFSFKVDQSCVTMRHVEVYSHPVSLCLLWRSACEVISSISSLLLGWINELKQHLVAPAAHARLKFMAQSAKTENDWSITQTCKWGTRLPMYIRALTRWLWKPCLE